MSQILRCLILALALPAGICLGAAPSPSESPSEGRKLLDAAVVKILGGGEQGQSTFALIAMDKAFYEDSSSLIGAVGTGLEGEELAVFKKALAREPDFVGLRALFLGWGWIHHHSAEDMAIYSEQLLWFIRKAPEAPAVGGIWARFERSEGAAAFDKIAKAWLQAVQKNPGSPKVRGHAAHFLGQSDIKTSDRLLVEATTLEPANLEWTKKRAKLYQDAATKAGRANDKKEWAAKAVSIWEEALAAATEGRFEILGQLASLAFERNDAEALDRWTDEIEDKAPYVKASESAPLIHRARILQGRMALGRGETAAASAFLIKAVNFPPDTKLPAQAMDTSLAKELLLKRQVEPVLEYLQAAARIWKGQKAKIESWIVVIRGGGFPDFSSEAKAPPGASKKDAATAKAFRLPRYQGGEKSLSDFKGKVVVLDFWATWCGPCRLALPSLQKLHETFKGKDVRVVLMTSDPENKAALDDLVKKEGLSMDILLDAGGKTAESYEITGYPNTFILDREGRIRHVHRGYSPRMGEELKRQVEELLRGGKGQDETAFLDGAALASSVLQPWGREAALKAARDQAARGPTDAKSQAALAQILDVLGEGSEAQALAVEGEKLALDSDQEVLWTLLMLKRNHGDHEGILKLCKRLKSPESSPHDVTEEVARASIGLGRYAEALEALDGAPEAEKNHYHLVGFRASALSGLGRREEAQTLVLNEHKKGGASYLVDTLFYLGQEEQALKLLDRSAGSDPWAMFNKAYRLLELGRISEAESIFQELILSGSGRVVEQSRAAIAGIRILEGKTAQAKELLFRAVASSGEMQVQLDGYPLLHNIALMEGDKEAAVLFSDLTLRSMRFRRHAVWEFQNDAWIFLNLGILDQAVDLARASMPDSLAGRWKAELILGVAEYRKALKAEGRARVEAALKNLPVSLRLPRAQAALVLSAWADKEGDSAAAGRYRSEASSLVPELDAAWLKTIGL